MPRGIDPHMSKEGKQDRDARLRTPHGGCWETHHSDMIRLTRELYELSRSKACSSVSRNASLVVYAGIPLLVSALQSFVIEYECRLPSDRTRLEPLTRPGFTGLVEILKTWYGVQGKLLQEARVLIDVRNYIVHPVPLPAGMGDDCPTHLRHLNQAGLLERTGEATYYYFMAQLASHRLFVWSCRVTRDLFQCVVNSNNEKAGWFQAFVDQLTSIGFEADLP